MYLLYLDIKKQDWYTEYMFKKNTILKYESSLDTYTNSITPAKKHIPDWYKKISKWKDGEIFSLEKSFQHTVKQCMPFLESFTIGYMITLPYDLYVKNNNGLPFLTWVAGVTDPPKWRAEVSDINIIPLGHAPIEYIWDCCVSYKVSKGYSILFTHPLNRHDLPFTTLTSVIDGGFTVSPHGNVPFYIKEGFEGIIPQGTPIAQLIPFRQESWKAEVSKGLVVEGEQNSKKTSSVIFGWYKKNYWVKKQYL